MPGYWLRNQPLTNHEPLTQAVQNAVSVLWLRVSTIMIHHDPSRSIMCMCLKRPHRNWGNWWSMHALLTFHSPFAFALRGCRCRLQRSGTMAQSRGDFGNFLEAKTGAERNFVPGCYHKQPASELLAPNGFVAGKFVS